MVQRAVPRNRITPEIAEQIKVAHAAGIGLREFARNANIPEGTVLSFAKRHGLTQEIQTAKGNARSDLQSDAISPLQSTTTVMVQRGQRYVERMATRCEGVVPYLEKMKPAKFIADIHEIKKFDDMTRRTFGLSDTTGVGGSLSVNVLTNQALVTVTKG